MMNGILAGSVFSFLRLPKYSAPAKAAKPDYIDIDGDGDKKESMKKAAQEKK